LGKLRELIADGSFACTWFSCQQKEAFPLRISPPFLNGLKHPRSSRKVLGAIGDVIGEVNSELGVEEWHG
jgi:hypothetical protein